IVTTQKTEAELRKLHVIALTATNRADNANNTASFTLTAADRENETVQKRIHATKRLSVIPLDEADRLDEKLATLAKAKPAGRAVLIFTRSVATALKVFEDLNKGAHKGMVAALT